MAPAGYLKFLDDALKGGQQGTVTAVYAQDMESKALACLGNKYWHNVTITSGMGTPEGQTLEAAGGGSIKNWQVQGRQDNLMGELSPFRG